MATIACVPGVMWGAGAGAGIPAPTGVPYPSPPGMSGVTGEDWGFRIGDKRRRVGDVATGRQDRRQGACGVTRQAKGEVKRLEAAANTKTPKGKMTRAYHKRFNARNERKETNESERASTPPRTTPLTTCSRVHDYKTAAGFKSAGGHLSASLVSLVYTLTRAWGSFSLTAFSLFFMAPGGWWRKCCPWISFNPCMS